MGKFIDLTGRKFGKLTVIKRVENTLSNKVNWLCKCECGKYSKVISSDLTKKGTKSCGCLTKKHGLTHHRLYYIWQDMKARCYNLKQQRYNRYGGRNIVVCDEWLNNFKSFYDWAMNNGYRDDLTIDRINNDGNYEPNNCRWATLIEQHNNTSRNRHLLYNGENLTIAEWSRKLNMTRNLIRDRLQAGWSVEKALTTPIKHKK